jgi:hypothetical protein
MLQRANALSVLELCGDEAVGAPLDVLSSPLRLAVGSSAARYYRGAVVGNAVVLWCGAVAAAAALSVLVWRCGADARFRSVLCLLKLPGRLLVPFLLLVEPTVEACVVLLRRSPPSVADVVLGVLGLVAALLPVAGCAVVVGPRFAAVPKLSPARCRRVVVGNRPRTVPVCGGTTAWLRSSFDATRALLLEPSLEYTDRVAGYGFVAMYGALFEDYRCGCHWYVVAELLSELSYGVIRGLVPAYAGRPSPPCEGLRIAMVMVVSVTMLTMAVVRPHAVMLDAVLSWGGALTVLVSSALLLAYGPGDAADTSVAVAFWVAVARVLVSLLLWLLSLRPVEDLRRVIAALRRGGDSLCPGAVLNSRADVDFLGPSGGDRLSRERALAVLVECACREWELRRLKPRGFT